MAKSLHSCGKDSALCRHSRQCEISDYRKIAEFVENLTELVKLQSTLLSHLQKTLKSLQAR